MDEVYAGRYRWQQGRWQVRQAPALMGMATLAEDWAGDTAQVLAGSALAAMNWDGTNPLSNADDLYSAVDSDLDGLTSLSILLNLFRRFGLDPFCRYAVFDEEYGLRPEVIREMKDKKIDLVITLDCGIRDVSEIALAGELGMDVIVCDHHEQGENLPDAIVQRLPWAE